MHFPPEGSKMKSKMFLLIPVFALAVCGVFAYSLLAQASDEIDIPFHKFVLNNGLTLIVHEDHKAPIVAVNVWYHVGSKNERLGKTGFAHLFEHLMFGGSEHARGRYIDAMEKIGATDLNGTTNTDRTNYFEDVPTNALDYTLWMESDRMGHLLGALDQKTLDLQRGVVHNEKRQVEKYFGDIPPGPPVAHQEVWIAKMTGTHRQIVQDSVPQARIYKIWNMPQYGSADADYLDLVSDILSTGKTSRLYKRLIYDDQIATSAIAYVDLREIAGQFYIQATARPGQNLDQVEKELDEELAHFLRDGPRAEELQRVKTEYMANFVRGIERIGGFGGKSDQLARNQVFLGDPAAYKISLKRVQEASAEDLRDAANRWLSDGVYILEVYPFPDYKAAAKGA